MGTGRDCPVEWPPQRIIWDSLGRFSGACPASSCSRTHTHHLGHLDAQFLVRCCQHGQGSSGRILHLVIIFPTEQDHQLQPVIPICQEPLLNLWEAAAGFRDKCPPPAPPGLRQGKREGCLHLKISDPGSLGVFLLLPSACPCRLPLEAFPDWLGEIPPIKGSKRIRDPPHTQQAAPPLYSTWHQQKRQAGLLEGLMPKEPASFPLGKACNDSPKAWAFQACYTMKSHV